jgi:hypothetical protein
MILTDLNGDGHLDLYAVQNFFHPQPETGRMDGGLSLLLLGHGDGTFAPVPTHRSGLLVEGDGRAAIVADWNADRWLDLVVAQNDGPIRAFQHRTEAAFSPLLVSLDGPLGNRSATTQLVTQRLSTT